MVYLTLLLLIMIIIFNLSNNRVYCLCPMRCTCLEEKLSVNCKESSLDVVPITLNPEIRELFLTNNHIKSITSSFSFYTKLQFLDLSGNQIASLDRKHLTFQGNLRVLLLQRNRISSLIEESFLGLSSLQLLNLNENLLTNLTSRAFNGLERLEKLDLSRNRISFIHDEAFFGLNNLKSLNFRSNQLTVVPSVALYLTPGLVKLDLGVNNIATLSDYGFSSLTRLADLRLDLCSIRLIQPKFAHGLGRSLRRLQLDGNNLTNLTGGLFSDLTQLQELMIGANRFSQLTEYTFHGLGSSLTFLDLRYARDLATLHPSSLAGLTQLTQLTIEYCPKLTRLDESLLKDSKSSLKEVRLRGNGLASLPYQLLNWPQLKLLDVRENPFVCNCTILWMWKYLRTANFTSPSNSGDLTRDITCSGPGALTGRRFLSLQADDMHCYDPGQGHLMVIALLVSGLICVLLFTLTAFWCRTRLPLVLLRHKKFTNNMMQDQDFVYEKGRIIENQVMFPPPLPSSSPYYHPAHLAHRHPSSSLIILQSPTKMGPISQV